MRLSPDDRTWGFINVHQGSIFDSVRHHIQCKTHTHTVISIIQYIIILQYYTHVYTSRFHCSLVWFHTIWVKRRYVLLWANAVKSSDWLWTSGCWDIVDRFEPEITVVFNVLHVFVLSKSWGLYIVLYNMWFWWTFRQDWNYGSMEPR